MFGTLPDVFLGSSIGKERQDNRREIKFKKIIEEIMSVFLKERQMAVVDAWRSLSDDLQFDNYCGCDKSKMKIRCIIFIKLVNDDKMFIN